MENTLLVSIALCTYNGQEHLADQIESIINQTYTNLEIIIVDDCSTDNTLAIAGAYAEKDTRIKFFRNQDNLGFNLNFEKAISLTHGQYIAISDQDDIWEPQKIQVLLDEIGDNWLIFSNSVCTDKDGTPTSKKLLENFSFTERDYRSVLIVNYVTGHTCLLSQQLLEHILPFPSTGYYDWWMGFIALYHHKLTYVDKVLTKYRTHENSVTQLVQKDEAVFKVIDLNVSVTMMGNFLAYKQLKDEDRRLISKLKVAYAKKVNTSYYLPLVKLINDNYHAIFPGYKKRKWFSKLKFALRYSRKLR